MKKSLSFARTASPTHPTANEKQRSLSEPCALFPDQIPSCDQTVPSAKAKDTAHGFAHFHNLNFYKQCNVGTREGLSFLHCTQKEKHPIHIFRTLSLCD